MGNTCPLLCLTLPTVLCSLQQLSNYKINPEARNHICAEWDLRDRLDSCISGVYSHKFVKCAVIEFSSFSDIVKYENPIERYPSRTLCSMGL